MFPLDVLLKREDKKGRVMRDGPLAIIIGIEAPDPKPLMSTAWISQPKSLVY